MSESNWGKWAIAGLVAIDLVLAASTIGHEINKTPTYYYAADQERSEPTLGSARIPTPAAEPRPEREEWREEQDLYAQRQMAKWALPMLVVSCLGVVVGAFGLFFLKRTLDETSAMTLATREIGENQVKAYVNIAHVAISEIKFDDNLLHLQADLQLTNTGSTPARRIKISTHCRVYSEGFAARKRGVDLESDIYNEDMYARDVVDLPPDKDGMKVFFVLPKPVEDHMLSKAHNALISRYIVISGKIEYSTVFRKRNLTEFVWKGYLPWEGMPIMFRESVPVATYKEIGKDEED